MSAKQKLSPPRSRGRLFLFSLLGFLFLFGPAARAGSLEEALRALARRVSPSLQGDSGWLNLKNRSALKEAELKKLSSVFKNELQQRGAKIVSDRSGSEILLTVSDCPAGYLGIVEIRRAAKNAEIFVASLGRAESVEQDRSPSGLVLRKELLFSQDRPLIDAAFYLAFSMIDTLGQGEVGLYELKDGRWNPAKTLYLPRSRGMSRELRGKVSHSVDAFAVSYFTEICRADARRGLYCENQTEPWPPHGVFRDVLNEKKTPPWYSAAEFTMNEKEAIVITGKDGLARLYSEGPEAVAVFPGWGSEIASIQSGCGNGWQILVTGKSDWTASDSIQALEVDGDQAREMTPAMDFPGPVIGLHTSGSGPLSTAETDGTIAIVHNLLTGRYDAYLLTINCPH